VGGVGWGRVSAVIKREEGAEKVKDVP